MLILDLSGRVLLALFMNYVAVPAVGLVILWVLLRRNLYEESWRIVPKVIGYGHLAVVLYLSVQVIYDIAIGYPSELGLVVILTILSLIFLGIGYTTVFDLYGTLLPLDYSRKEYFMDLLKIILVVFGFDVLIVALGPLSHGLVDDIITIEPLDLAVWIIFILLNTAIICLGCWFCLVVAENFSQKSRNLIEKFVDTYGVLSIGLLTRNHMRLGLPRELRNAEKVMGDIAKYIDLHGRQIIPSEEIVIVPDSLARFIKEGVEQADTKTAVMKTLKIIDSLSEELKLKKIKSYKLLLSTALNRTLSE